MLRHIPATIRWLASALLICLTFIAADASAANVDGFLKKAQADIGTKVPKDGCLPWVKKIASAVGYDLPDGQDASDPSRNKGNKYWNIAGTGKGWSSLIKAGDVLRFTWSYGPHSVIIKSVSGGTITAYDNGGNYSATATQTTIRTFTLSPSSVTEKSVTVYRMK